MSLSCRSRCRGMDTQNQDDWLDPTAKIETDMLDYEVFVTIDYDGDNGT